MNLFTFFTFFLKIFTSIEISINTFKWVELDHLFMKLSIAFDILF